MKVYTINNSRVSQGAVLHPGSLGDSAEKRTLYIGAGKKGKHIPMFKKNPPVIDMNEGRPYGGVITDAHPVKVEGGYALAKPNRDSDKVLVVVSNKTMLGNHFRGLGEWNFDSKTTPTTEAIDQTLVRATGPRNFDGDQDKENNIGWFDALIIMKPGDAVTVIDQSRNPARVTYESVEKGLVVDTRVRMVLKDYDNAPDGDGEYTKLNQIFPSKKAALLHRSRFMADMYWGRIETLDSLLVQWIEERQDN